MEQIGDSPEHEWQLGVESAPSCAAHKLHLEAWGRDNVPDMRSRCCRKLHMEERCDNWDNGNWTYNCQYANPGDALTWMTINLWQWQHAQICTKQLVCCTTYNPDYYFRDKIRYCVAETTMSNTWPNTMQNTMPNTMPHTMASTILNTMPSQFRSYITQCNIKIQTMTETRWSWAVQLRWQLRTVNRRQNPPIQIYVPYWAIWE